MTVSGKIGSILQATVLRAGLTAGLCLALAGAAPALATTLTYTYDDLGRLATTTYSDDGAVITNSYDDADNRTALQVTELDAHFAVTGPESPVAEGADLVYTVTRTGDLSQAQTIDIETTFGGSAASAADYEEIEAMR